MADLITLVPTTPEYAALRGALLYLRRDFPEKYAALTTTRVQTWVSGVKAGTYTADDKRDDIVKYVVGKEDAMAKYGITAAEFDQLVMGADDGGVNWGDVGDLRGQDLNNIPGAPEVWKVGDQSYVVYMVPDTEADPVYMSWRVPSKSDLTAMFGPDQPIVYDRTISEAAFKNEGVINFGTTDEIPPGEQDPFVTWADQMDVLAQTQPWILDDDYQALMAMALVEGRTLTEAEIATTKWFSTHSPAERTWMAAFHGDPKQAEQMLQDGSITVAEKLNSAGAGADPDSGVVDFLTKQWVQGKWSEAELDQQIRAITDQFSGIVIDPTLAGLLDTNPLRQTVSEEDTVRDLLHTWLGPAFGNWSDAEISRVAGEIRNDDEAQARFVETLKDQRLALLPNYGDRELSYQAVANTWKQWWLGQWGEAPDETSDLWMQVLSNNNMAESGKLLRREGYNQGNKKVIDDLNRQTMREVGTSVRPGVYA